MLRVYLTDPHRPMAMMWRVQAGERGRLFEEFRKKGVVGIGWKELGDLSAVKGVNEIRNLLSEKFPGGKPGWFSISSSQLAKFRFEMKSGDWVVTYNPEARDYLVGKIDSDYIYDPKIMEYPHLRKVVWKGTVSRDKLSVATKNTLGGISTLFRVGTEAEGEITHRLSGSAPPTEVTTEESESEVLDVVGSSNERIKDHILAFDPWQVQDLVAAILRAMGYKTAVTKPGEKGHDVRASPDGLGLVDPRIVVEVKHRESRIDKDQVASFIHSITQGKKGLYVSTGGFTSAAESEAEHASQTVTLVNLDMLIDLINQYYDNFDKDGRVLLQLRKIYWPA